MQKITIEDISIGDRVFYIPGHLETNMKNAEEGYITTIKDNRVWVRYKGPQGNLTPIRNLYK